eukprot:6208617-Pleurochrysis_carterae.AAC.1
MTAQKTFAKSDDCISGYRLDVSARSMVHAERHQDLEAMARVAFSFFICIALSNISFMPIESVASLRSVSSRSCGREAHLPPCVATCYSFSLACAVLISPGLSPPLPSLPCPFPSLPVSLPFPHPACPPLFVSV